MGLIGRKLVIKTLRIFDLLTMTSVFILAAVLVSTAAEADTFGEFLSMRIKVGNFLLFFGFLALWHLIFVLTKVYQPQRLVPQNTEATNIIRATTMGTLCIAALSLIFSIRMVNPVFLLVFWLIITDVR